MIRKLAIGVATVSLAAAGIVATGGGVASAATPVLTGITSANVDCNITAKATLVPALKNNWVKAQHTGDASAAVVALPDTQFAALNTANNTSAKSKGTCSGTITGPSSAGVATMSVTAAKIGLATTTQSIDNAPLNNNGGSTCTGLLAGTAGEDVAAKYTSTVSLKGSGAKLPTFSIVGSSVTPAGLGFSVTGGTASAPATGATGASQANVDTATLLAVTAGPPTSTVPSTSKCQPGLKVKTKQSVTTATLKAPKGLKKLVIANGTFTLDK